MITKTKARRILDYTIRAVDPKKTKIKWEMATFRHVVLNTIEILPTLKTVKWYLNLRRKLTTCKFIFQDQTFECSYSLVTKKITIWNKKTDFFQNVSVEDFPKVMKAHAPKIKITLKRKTEVR